jgi:hypothetical protein
MITSHPEKKSVLFHVGLPKAASTFLQKRVFPAIADATFLNITSANLGHPSKLRSGSAAFLSDPAAARAAIVEAEHSNVIVSAEGFVGDPYKSFQDHERRAQNLHATWPDATVLLVIRRQDNFCQSLFGQVLRKGFPYSPARFLRLDGQASSAARHFDFRAADFDRIVCTYETLFGRERVFVIPLELLIEDPVAFLNIIRDLGPYQLPDLAAAPAENKAYAHRGYLAARLLNGLCFEEYESGFRFLGWLDRKAAGGDFAWRLLRKMVRHGSRTVRRLVRRGVNWIGSRGNQPAKPLSDDQLAKIRFHFASSNRKLSERLNLGLERYGYF